MLLRAALIVATFSLLLSATPAPSRRLSDIIALRLVEGALQLEWIDAQPPPGRSTYFAGPEATWIVRSPAPRDRLATGAIELERPPAGVRDRLSYWSIFVSSSPQRLYLTGHRGGRAAIDTSMRFTQTADGAVHLTVYHTAGRKFTQVRAANLIELRSAHPDLVRQFLVPMLRQISGDDALLPGATDVYRVFAEISPDAATESEVHTILPDLAHPSYDRRQGATAELESLGPPAVCALLRMDRSALLPEQRLRIEHLLAINSHRMMDDPAAARRDASFLADCLEFPDERVRRIAKRELEQLLDRPIPMHPVPTPAEWSRAADVIRQRLATPQSP